MEANNEQKEERHPNKFTKTVKVQFDGRQHSIRIPALIAKEMGMPREKAKDEEKKKFTFEFHLGKTRKENKLYVKYEG
ncbi:hypothetical protein J4234_02990 [Candidatus Woesearchaeota archaeon]|nr:hypothetical protein [Candidatus Woesearchaeota archaeon]